MKPAIPCQSRLLGILVVLSWMAGVPETVFGQVPTITVDTAIQHAHEVGPAPGIFIFSRAGNTASALTVNFELSGTATRGVDYIMWEPSARFEPGATTAYVTVLPRNDVEREDDETIVLEVSPGPDYAVGAASTATVVIGDFGLGASFPGVFDWADSALGLQNDLIYLEARTVGGYLVIRTALNSTSMSTVQIWLDTDQNPATGDIRQGYAAGPEYRVEAFVFVAPDYQLWRLPRNQNDCGNPACPEQSIILRGPAWMESANMLVLAIPLTAIDNPSAVDVYATTNNGTTANRLVGDGDRAPDFGALDSRTGRVVVRRPSVTSSRALVDVAHDASDPRGFDLAGVQFDTIADQVFITVTWSQHVDATGFFPGATGQIVVDSDRSLLTGGFPLLDPQQGIPTWGGDMRLKFEISAFGTGITNLLLQFDGTGSGTVMFGQASNDGRWMVGGSAVWLACSTSVLDAFRKTADGVERVPGTGKFIAAVDALFNSEQGVADSLPGQHRVFDTATGRVLTPFAWDRPTVVSDPRELFGLSGVDLTGVQAEVIDAHLVVRGILASWLTSDAGNYYEILLDTDTNAFTAPLGRWNGTGADYKVEIASVDGITAAYVANLILPDGTRVVADSMLFANTSLSGLESGSFTVTIPLSAIGNPQQLLFVVTSGALWGPGRMDTAPSTPLLVETRGAETR